MAVKSADVLARVEPDVKEQAEAILLKLGVPASVVINMLYKQIIMTKSIPFPLSVPEVLVTRDEMDDSEEIESLSHFPNSVALTEDEPWHSLGIHRLPAKSYLVYFWIDEPAKKVQVTAIVYGRRAQKQALSQMPFE